MAIEAHARGSVDREVRPASAGAVSRAEFDAFFDEWFPRVFRFLAARMSDREDCEAAARNVLEIATREELFRAPAPAGARLLALAQDEVGRRRAHAFVTGTPRFIP